MEQFQGRHYPHANNSPCIFVVLSENGNIILSDSLKNNIICSEPIQNKYVIVHSGNILSYAKLQSITNALSVISSVFGFVILLDVGTLVYIILEIHIERLKIFNQNICNEHIQKIDKFPDTEVYILYFTNKLLITQYGLEFKVFENVYGYYIISDTKTILTLDQNGYIHTTLDILFNKFDEIAEMDEVEGTDIIHITSTKIFEGVNISDVKYLFACSQLAICILYSTHTQNIPPTYSLSTLHTNKVSPHTLHTTPLLYYSKNKNIEMYMKLTKIDMLEKIEYFDSFLLCACSNKTVIIFKNIDTSIETISDDYTEYDEKILLDTVECITYHNVEKYLKFPTTLVLLLTNKSLKYIPSKHLPSAVSKFLEDTCEFIDEFVMYTCINFIPHMFYITNNNKVQIVNMKTFEPSNLNLFLDSVDSMYINIKTYNQCSYI